MSDQVPLPTAALSPVAIDTLAWSAAGRALVTVSVRADVRLVHGGVATLAEPQALLRADHYTMPGPIFRTPRQVVPSLQQPEITLMACAHAGGAIEATVRLAVFRSDGARLVDKTLLVRGRQDRRGEPRPVDGLQLDYCSAVGGIGFQANPLGRGKGRTADEGPNIFDPQNVDAVVGFCPVPSGFAARSGLLGAHHPRVASGDVALPEGFDHRFFQAAPADQRVAALRGDERIVLERMNAEHAVFDTRLPGLTAVARLYGEGGPQALTLRLESLHLDAEEKSAVLVWRATFASPAPARPTVAAQLVEVGQTVGWPASIVGDAAGGRRSVEASAASRTVLLEQPAAPSVRGTMLLEQPAAPSVRGTMLVEPDAERAGMTNPSPEGVPGSLPFSRPAAPTAARRSPNVPPAGLPWAGGGAPVRPAREALAGTVALSGSSPPASVTRDEERRRADDATRRDEAARVEAARLAAEREARERRELEREEQAKVAAERFAKEQDAARKTEEQRRATEAAERAKAIQGLKKKAYGGFDD